MTLTEANNNKFPVNILMRFNRFEWRARKGFVCLHCVASASIEGRKNCLKTGKRGWARCRRSMHTYNHEIKCLMVFIFHFWGCESELYALEQMRWLSRLASASEPFLIKFSNPNDKIPPTWKLFYVRTNTLNLMRMAPGWGWTGDEWVREKLSDGGGFYWFGCGRRWPLSSWLGEINEIVEHWNHLDEEKVPAQCTRNTEWLDKLENML